MRALGPYQISRFSRPTATGVSLFFTLSTWNPYTVVLMESELVLRD